MCLAGVPTLGELQSRKKEMKRAKTACLQITCVLELMQFCLAFKLPDTYGTLQIGGPATAARLTEAEADEGGGTSAGHAAAVPVQHPQSFPSPFNHDHLTAASKLRMLYVPMDNLAFQVEGALLTGRMQLHWLKQLLAMPLGFVLHADGKHKLHHGGWILIALGTHQLRWDQHHLTLSKQFVPLVYLFCKQHESNGAALMVTQGVKALANKYFPESELQPGACMSDHSDAFRSAYEQSFPEAPFGTCWPHIIRKWTEGEYPRLTHDPPSQHCLRCSVPTDSVVLCALQVSTARRRGRTWTRWQAICACCTWLARQRCVTS